MLKQKYLKSLKFEAKLLKFQSEYSEKQAKKMRNEAKTCEKLCHLFRKKKRKSCETVCVSLPFRIERKKNLSEKGTP
jgi:hypothetical protein